MSFSDDNLPSIEQLTYVTLTELGTMCASPGNLEIHITPVGEYYVPVVIYTPPEGSPATRGTIVNAGRILASPVLDELAAVLQETVGPFVEIRLPGAPAPRRIHH